MRYIYILSILLLFTSCNKHKNDSNLLSNQDILEQIENNDKSPSSNRKTLDSLFDITKKKAPKSSQLIDIASKAYNLELYEQYFKYSKEANQLAIKNKDSLLIAKSLWYIGDYFDYKMQLDSAYIYFDKAEQVYHKTKSNTEVAKMLQYKSIVLFREGLYNEAENIALDALETLEKDHNSELLYQIYLNLGNILDLNQQPNEALAYYSSAILILEDIYHNQLIPDDEYKQSMASCYHNIGNLYLNQRSYTKAKTFLTDAYHILLDLETINEPFTIILTNLGTLNLQIDNLKEAETLLSKSLEISQKKGYKQSLIANNFRLGDFYLLQRDTIQAIQYYKNAYIFANKIKANNTVLKSLKALSLIDKENSIKYAGLYYTFNDSINKLQISKRNKFARIKYESEKLEKNIIKLKKENSKLLITAMTVVFIIIVLLFIILYRNKIKKYTFLKQDKENKEIIFKLLLDQEQLSQEILTKERDRISQELHDGIINSLFIIRLSLSNADNNGAILKEIEKVQDQIRLISHDLKNHEFIQQGFSEIITQLVEKNSTDKQKFQLIISKSYKWDNITYDDKINIYRILQETIQNVIKHSQAKNCIISIFQTEITTRITITDDGIGFNYAKLKNSNGLKNIYQRTKHLNATLDVDSNQHGTVFIINIPLK